MKKLLGICGLLFCLMLGVNSSFAFDREKIQAVSEIGTLSNSQKYILALDKCNAALEKYPFDPELYYWRATINLHLGEGEQALKDMNMAIDINPNDSNVFVMRGILKSELGDNEGALADFEHAIKLDPKNSSAYSMRACVKIVQGEFKAANEDLEIANKLLDEEELKEVEAQKEEVNDTDNKGE